MKFQILIMSVAATLTLAGCETTSKAGAEPAPKKSTIRLQASAGCVQGFGLSHGCVRSAAKERPSYSLAD